MRACENVSIGGNVASLSKRPTCLMIDRSSITSTELSAPPRQVREIVTARPLDHDVTVVKGGSSGVAEPHPKTP